MKEPLDIPLVLLTDIVLLAQVDEVGDGFGCEELKAIDDINLRKPSQQNKTQKKFMRESEEKCSQWHIGALLPPRRAGLIELAALYHHKKKI